MNRVLAAIFAALALVICLSPSSAEAAPRHKKLHKPDFVTTRMGLTTTPATTRSVLSSAQTGLSSAQTGLNAVLTSLTMNSLADLQLAVALAKNANTTNSNQRAACYAQVEALVAQQNGIMIATSGLTLQADASGQVVNTAAPGAASTVTQSIMANAAVFSHAEQLAQLVDALQPGSPLMTACSPLATQVKSDMGTLLSTILKGGISLATFGL